MQRFSPLVSLLRVRRANFRQKGTSRAFHKFSLNFLPFFLFFSPNELPRVKKLLFKRAIKKGIVHSVLISTRSSLLRKRKEKKYFLGEERRYYAHGGWKREYVMECGSRKARWRVHLRGNWRRPFPISPVFKGNPLSSKRPSLGAYQPIINITQLFVVGRISFSYVTRKYHEIEREM